MGQLISSAQLIDLVIGFTALEGLALALYHRLTGRGLAPAAYGLNLLAGLCLMLALRSAISTEQGFGMVPWLAASGLAHGTDLWMRWRQQAADAPKSLATNPSAKVP
jgi:hypothetical protein